jgi:hypothetical protein
MLVVVRESSLRLGTFARKKGILKGERYVDSFGEHWINAWMKLIVHTHMVTTISLIDEVHPHFS